MNRNEFRKAIIDILKDRGEKYFDREIFVTHWGQYIIEPEEIVDDIVDLFYLNRYKEE